MKRSTYSVTDIALLAAFCMFLSVIEYLIPKPMPFMRLGLANVPILISLTIFPVQGTILLTLLKVLGQGLVNGTLFSYVFIFSAAGSFASCAAMIASYKLLKKHISLIGVSILGAMASNIIQILLARQFIFGRAAILIAPPFLAVGLVSAVVLGVFTVTFLEKSEWVRRQRERACSPADLQAGSGIPSVSASPYSRFVFICGLMIIPAFIFQQNIFLKCMIAAAFMALSTMSGKKFRLLPNLIMFAAIVAANLITPYGRIITRIGSFPVTSGAVNSGLDKAALLIGLIYISRFTIRKGLVFPGRIGGLISMVFFYFERITEGEKLTEKNLLRKLDEKLLNISSAEAAPQSQTPETRQPAIRYILMTVLIILMWTLTILSPVIPISNGI